MSKAWSATMRFNLHDYLLVHVVLQPTGRYAGRAYNSGKRNVLKHQFVYECFGFFRYSPLLTAGHKLPATSLARPFRLSGMNGSVLDHLASLTARTLHALLLLFVHSSRSEALSVLALPLHDYLPMICSSVHLRCDIWFSLCVFYWRPLCLIGILL